MVRIPTDVSKHMLSDLGNDSRFYSDPQFRLNRDASGGWHVEHIASAKNATTLNGNACTESTALTDGDVLAVGNPEKGVIKLPLRVRLG